MRCDAFSKVDTDQSVRVNAETLRQEILGLEP